MLTSQPFTLVCLLCMSNIAIGVTSALICKDNDDCYMGFSLPLTALWCVMCVVSAFALFYMETNQRGMY